MNNKYWFELGQALHKEIEKMVGVPNNLLEQSIKTSLTDADIKKAVDWLQEGEKMATVKKKRKKKTKTIIQGKNEQLQAFVERGKNVRVEIHGNDWSAFALEIRFPKGLTDDGFDFSSMPGSLLFVPNVQPEVL